MISISMHQIALGLLLFIVAGIAVVAIAIARHARGRNAPSPSIKARLAELTELRDQGEASDEEDARARAKVLDRP